MDMDLRGLPLLLLGAAALHAQTTCPAMAVYSPCDIVFELNEAEAAAHPNPYSTVDLRAEFRSPRHRTYLMPAFWDCGNAVKLFRAPPRMDTSGSKPPLPMRWTPLTGGQMEKLAQT